MGVSGGMRVKMEYTHVTHTFAPVFDARSEVLILGSFPSVKSRENQFYYGHPRNRFWSVLAEICQVQAPVTIEEKRAFLLGHRIAVWDVIASCDIAGSADSSIRNVEGNDMDVILKKAQIRRIFANGDTAYKLFGKYCRQEGQPAAERLPSTSPANAAWSLVRLTETWREAFALAGLKPADYV